MKQDSELISLLDGAKREMMCASQTAGVAGQWERGKYLFQCASDIDRMIAGLQRNGFSPAPARPMMPTTQLSRPTKLPYFFIEENKLAKLGPSRDGSTYQHNVIREHYDLMIEQLTIMAREGKNFETPDLVNRCDIPKHEPLIMLAVLEEQKLLVNTRRGRWTFVNPETFPTDVQRVWNALPRQ
jgi:hypothetical protein